MSKKVNLCLLLPHLDLGGGSRRIKVYCDYLDKKKFNVSVVIYSNNIRKDIDSIIGKKTPRLISADSNRIEAFFKKQNISSLYTYYDGSFQQPLYDILTSTKKLQINLIANNVFSYYDQRMDNLFDKVVFQTQMMRDIKFRKNYPQSKSLNQEKYLILRNPVDEEYLNKFKLSRKLAIELRHNLGIPENAIVVSRFGRNDIIKWGDYLFQAIFKLYKLPNIYFLIVGIPKSRKFLINFAKIISKQIKERVIIVEPTADDQKLMSLMQISDIIAHSVRIGEGCSNAINEAMYWSKPVVTNSTPNIDNGQVEQLKFGEAGIIVNSAAEFSDQIVKLANSKQLRAKIGKSAYRLIVENCSAQKIATHFGQIILYRSSIDKYFGKQLSFQEYRKLYFAKIQSGKEEYSNPMKQIIRVLNYLEYKLIQ